MARRLAILIGNARFTLAAHLEDLSGPPNDVEQLGAVLGDPARGGFEVLTFVDRPRSDVLPAIEEALNTAEIDDLVLLFYAGHGTLDPNGRLCLATAETRALALRTTSISLSELKELIGQSRAASTILLLDCCFSGAAGKEFMNRGGGVDSQLTLMREAQGLHILTASTGLQTARERDHAKAGLIMGAFTRAVVEGIRSGEADRNRDGEVSVDDLRTHLSAVLRGQTPKYFAHDAHGDPMIARAIPAKSPKEVRLERLGVWHSEGQLTDDQYLELTAAVDGRDQAQFVALIERLLDNPKATAMSLFVAWNAAKRPPSPIGSHVLFAPPAAAGSAAISGGNTRVSLPPPSPAPQPSLPQAPPPRSPSRSIIIGTVIVTLAASLSYAGYSHYERLRIERDAEASKKAAPVAVAEEERRAAVAAEYRRAGRQFRECPECPEMVVVPAGSFMMGSQSGESDEKPVHEVKIAQPFAVGKFEVTFAQWDACVAAQGCKHRPEDRGWGRDTRPVMNVSWDDAKEYVTWLSARTGQGYRLLSEAEWEYVARGGSPTEVEGKGNANCDGCGSQWDNKQTAPVGHFKPNGYGVYDMLGNVWEWTEDCWNDSYARAPSDGSAWTAGDFRHRVLRGGSWNYGPRLARSADRYRSDTANRDGYTGFRVARTL